MMIASGGETSAFVMRDTNGLVVNGWSFDCLQTWKIYPVSPKVRGTARSVFSLLVRSQEDVDTATCILGDLNRGEDLSCLEAFCKGKVTTDSQWLALGLGLGGGNVFEIKYANYPSIAGQPEGLDRARLLEQRKRSEVWHIVVKNDFKGVQRSVFSFVVRGWREAFLVTSTVEILNRDDRPNPAMCPFFCVGKVSRKAEIKQFEEWLDGNSSYESLLASDRTPF